MNQITNKDNRKPAFFTYVFCITTYFFMIFVNDSCIAEYLKMEEASFTEYEEITLFKIYGGLVASVVILFAKNLSFKIMIISSLIFYLLSTVHIIIVDISYDVQLLYFFIYNASVMIVAMLLLGYILIDTKIYAQDSIALYVASILIAYTLAQIIEYFDLRPFVELLSSNIFLMTVFIVSLIVSYQKNLIIENSRFSAVVKHVEIETLIGFTIFYIIMVIKEGYEVYAIVDSLIILETNIKLYVELFSIISALVVSVFLIPKFNTHKLNIACLVILSIMIMSMESWDRNLFSSIICRIIIINALYMLFVSSIVLLSKKFQNVNLLNALSIYLIGSSFGYYCGYVTINKSEDTIGANGFLISISFVLIGLLLYYLYFFNKNKLYR